MARHHFIASDEPIKEAFTDSVCGKRCAVLSELATDEDLQYFEMSRLTKCKKCQAACGSRYLYVGREV
jgi:hypothetical protein